MYCHQIGKLFIKKQKSDVGWQLSINVKQLLSFVNVDFLKNYFLRPNISELNVTLRQNIKNYLSWSHIKNVSTLCQSTVKVKELFFVNAFI